jgi:hypothetical protein
MVAFDGSAFLEPGFDDGVGFVGGYKDRARVIHAERAEIGEMELPAG